MQQNKNNPVFVVYKGLMGEYCYALLAEFMPLRENNPHVIFAAEVSEKFAHQPLQTFIQAYQERKFSDVFEKQVPTPARMQRNGE